MCRPSQVKSLTTNKVISRCQFHERTKSGLRERVRPFSLQHTYNDLLKEYFMLSGDFKLQVNQLSLNPMTTDIDKERLSLRLHLNINNVMAILNCINVSFFTVHRSFNCLKSKLVHILKLAKGTF